MVRHFRQGGAIQFEDIGAFRTPVQALLMTTREAGRARVLDPDGRVYSDNGQPIEER